MNKEEKRKYIFAQLKSLPNAFQYVEVTTYIKDLENVMGNFIQTELDCVEKQNQEIEQLQQENQQLTEEIKKIKLEKQAILDAYFQSRSKIKTQKRNRKAKVRAARLEKEKYKTRIDKAIEYINNCLIGYEEQYEEHSFNYLNVRYDLENILEILKGEDSNGFMD